MSENRLTAKIAGVGKALPEKRLTNADLEQMIDTSDEWITQRVGIKERRIAADGEYTSDLAVQAAAQALQRAGIAAEELDMILVGTSTPDMIYPSVACLVQAKLGATRAGALDVSAACTGFIYAATLAWGMIKAGMMKHILVIGAEVNSAVVNWKDRDTCVLFGDGAGAVVMSAHNSADQGVLASTLGADGKFDNLLYLANSGIQEFPEFPGKQIVMLGNEVFKQAVRNMYDCAINVLEQAGLAAVDVDMLIPHQANTRIISAVAKRLGLKDNQVFVNIGPYGNTSAASIPIAMCEAVEQGKLKSGDLLVIDAFGAGLTFGAMAIRWV